MKSKKVNKKEVTEKKLINKWLAAHRLLNADEKIQVRSKVMEYLEISRDTFYRKMNNPSKLKPYEKQMIALAYGKTATAMFGKTKKLPAIPL